MKHVETKTSSWKDDCSHWHVFRWTTRTPTQNMNWMSKGRNHGLATPFLFYPFLTYGYNAQCLHIVTNTTCKLSLSSPVERTGSKEVKVSDGGGCFQSHKMKSILVWALLEGQIPAMCFSTFCQGRRCLTKYLCLNGPNSFMRGFSQVFVGI